MIVLSGYPQASGRCQPPPSTGSSWSPVARLGATWRRNPNYRHGRWCRYRLRLEAKLARAERAIARYRAEAPRYAPFAGPHAWPPAGLLLSRRTRYLPRRAWTLAVQLLGQVRFARHWMGLWQARQAAGLPGPVPILATLGIVS